tara:strand:+ start:203 stop:400 length:198 start_codon:yes stop_codon:yes gene_type:complete
MREDKPLNNIIKNCELILDQLSLGAEMTESDFNTLGYIEGSIVQLKEKIYKNLDFQIADDIQKNN